MIQAPKLRERADEPLRPDRLRVERDRTVAAEQASRRPRVDGRRVISGIFHILRTGTPWRNLPERCGPHATVCNRYNRWARQGVRERLFEALAARSPGSLHLINSSVVCVHQHAAGGKKGVRITPSDAREAG